MSAFSFSQLFTSFYLFSYNFCKILFCVLIHFSYTFLESFSSLKWPQSFWVFWVFVLFCFCFEICNLENQVFTMRYFFFNCSSLFIFGKVFLRGEVLRAVLFCLCHRCSRRQARVWCLRIRWAPENPSENTQWKHPLLTQDNGNLPDMKVKEWSALCPPWRPAWAPTRYVGSQGGL